MDNNTVHTAVLILIKQDLMFWIVSEPSLVKVELQTIVVLPGNSYLDTHFINCCTHQTRIRISPGLYCKWKIRGDLGVQLQLDILDPLIEPQSPECLYDGLVIYDGDPESDSKYGTHMTKGRSILQSKRSKHDQYT